MDFFDLDMGQFRSCRQVRFDSSQRVYKNLRFSPPFERCYQSVPPIELSGIPAFC